jgi:hypothetical protein
MLEIRNFLTLSTGHVSEATAKILDNNKLEDWPCFGGTVSTVGWFIYAHDENPGDIPADLFAVFEYARKHNCPYVLFDCDADTIEELPTFDW